MTQTVDIDGWLKERAETQRVRRLVKDYSKKIGNIDLQLRILVSVRFDLTRGCWLSKARTTSKGRVSSYIQPRDSYLAFRGFIGLDKEADHCCRVPVCMNPWHLSAVTKAENFRRRFLTAEEHWALRDEVLIA